MSFDMMMKLGMCAESRDGAQHVSAVFEEDIKPGKFITKTGITVENGIKVVKATTDVVYGVSIVSGANYSLATEGTFKAGDTANVAKNDVIYMLAGENLAEGAKVKSNASGDPISADSATEGAEVNATAKSSAVAGEIVAIEFNI